MRLDIATGPIALAVSDGVAVEIAHGFGREAAGWLVIWRDAAVSFTALASSAPDQVLRLLPSGTGNVRIVLL